MKTNETVILIELLDPSNYACFIPTGQGYKLFHSPAPDNIAFHYLESTVRADIFAVVLFSRISRVKPSRKFPLQFMSIYSNDNISKIAKLTTRELPHLAKTAKITVRENNGVYSICMYIKLINCCHVNKRRASFLVVRTVCKECIKSEYFRKPVYCAP